MNMLATTKLIAFNLMLSALTINGQETYSASSTLSETPECNLATSADTCNLYCDSRSPDVSFAFSCGSAGICNFICKSKQCFRHASTLDASGSSELNVIHQGSSSCMEATVNLPNYGSAYFSVSGNAINPFDRMTVNSGIHTNEIYINCTGNSKNSEDIPDCNAITVNAQRAQYLHINVHNDGYMYGGQIYCPKSEYGGLNESPCIINSNNGIMSHVNIYASRGYPNSVNIYPGQEFNYVNIICNSPQVSGIWSNVPSNFPSNGQCFFNGSITSTSNPTISGINLSEKVTFIPSLSPTLYPNIETSDREKSNQNEQQRAEQGNNEGQQGGSLLIPYSDEPSTRVLAMSIVVLFCLTTMCIWNWRMHKIHKDEKLGYVQSKQPFFTDMYLLLWGLGSGYGIIFAVKSPFYELLKVSTSVALVFKGVVAILTGFTIGLIHVYYESENDYSKVKRSFSNGKKINSKDPKSENGENDIQIYRCNFKDPFLVFWSLGSGYGIIFAIESWIYEIFGIKTQLGYIMKVTVALLVGIGIGCIHFYYDILQDRMQQLKNRNYAQCNDDMIMTDNEIDTGGETTENELNMDDEFAFEDDGPDNKNNNMMMSPAEIDADQLAISDPNQLVKMDRMERTSTVETQNTINNNQLFEPKPKKINRWQTSPGDWSSGISKFKTIRSKTTIF